MAEVAPAKSNGVAKGAADKKAPVERPQKPDEEVYKKELERLEKELSKAQERFVSEAEPPLASFGHYILRCDD